MGEAAARVRFEVDSKQVKEASNNLKKLKTDANKASVSIEKLSTVTVKSSLKNAKARDTETKAIKKYGKEVSAVQKLARGEARRTERIATGIDPRTGKMARDLGVNRFNTANIAAQFQDIGVTAAMGMNPMTIALQQGTQLSAILNNMGNPVKGLQQAFTQLVNPVALVSVGITGLVAALIQMVDWSSAGSSALDFLTKHVELVTAGVVALAVSFAYFEKSRIASIWKDNLLPVLDNVWKKIKLLIPATITFGSVLKGVGTAVLMPFKLLAGILTLAATKVVAIIGAITAVITIFLELTGVMNILNRKFREWRENAGRKEFWKEMDKNINEQIAALKLEGELIGKSTFEQTQRKTFQDMYNKALEKKVALTGTDITKMREASIQIAELTEKNERLEEQQRKWEEYLENSKAFLNKLDKENEALLFQQSLLGKNEQLVKNLEYAQQLRNEAIEKGLINDKDMMTTLDEVKFEKAIQGATDLKETYDKNADSLAAYNKRVNEAQSVTTGFFTDMNHALIEGQTLWEAFGNAVTNVLTKILDKITQIGVDQLFAAGKASGWFSGLFGGTPTEGGTTTTVKTAEALGGVWSNGIRKFATGGVVGSATLFGTRNGLGLMGEAGPEAIMPLTRGANGELGVKAEGVGGSPVVVNVINNSNAKATVNQRQTSQGTEIDVMIDQLVADKLGTLGTASNTAMNTWNNRQLIAR